MRRGDARRAGVVGDSERPMLATMMMFAGLLTLPSFLILMPKPIQFSVFHSTQFRDNLSSTKAAALASGHPRFALSVFAHGAEASRV